MNAPSSAIDADHGAQEVSGPVVVASGGCASTAWGVDTQLAQRGVALFAELIGTVDGDHALIMASVACDLTEAELADAIATGDVADRRHAASGLRLPEKLVESLICDSDAAVRFTLAQNPTLTCTQVAALCRDRDVNVRTIVSGHPALNDAAFEHLAGDLDVAVRRGIARRRDLPSGVRSKLEHDPDAGVRAALVLGEAAER